MSGSITSGGPCRWSEARQRWERVIVPGVSKESCGHAHVVTERALTVDDLLDAVEAAEARALAEHHAGTCHTSEWFCSYCEAQDA